VKKQEVGQSLLEFVLLLVVLLPLTLGGLDLALAVVAKAELSSITREGARVGAVQIAGTPLDSGKIINTVFDRVVTLDESRLEVDLSGSNSWEVVVKTSYSYLPLTPFLKPLTLEYQVTMRRE